MILIRLAETPATGYKWKANIDDTQIIALEDSKFLIDAETGIGGGGVTTFDFKARSPGTTKVRLSLERPWNQNDVIKHFEVTLDVK